MMNDNDNEKEDDDSSSSSICDAFAVLDMMADVDFDKVVVDDDDAKDDNLVVFDSYDQKALLIEQSILWGNDDHDDHDDHVDHVDGSEEATTTTTTTTATKMVVDHDNDKVEKMTKNEKKKEQSLIRVKVLQDYITTGQYVTALQSSDSAKKWLFQLQQQNEMEHPTTTTATTTTTVWEQIQYQLSQKLSSIVECVEVECLAIAALNLFLQLNYTGPTLDDENENEKNEEKKTNSGGGGNTTTPSATIKTLQQELIRSGLISSLSTNEVVSSPSQQPEVNSSDSNKNNNKDDDHMNNAIFSELAVDGIWPCQVAQAPYLLLLARAILLPLTLQSQHQETNNSGDDLDTSTEKEKEKEDSRHGQQLQQQLLPSHIQSWTCHLKAALVWSARAVVAHERLLLLRDEPSKTLWEQVERLYPRAIEQYNDSAATTTTTTNATVIAVEQQNKNKKNNNIYLSTLYLEWSLAHVHFDRPGYQKLLELSRSYSGLTMEITGAMGKRTKYQQKATAQYVVRAQSSTVMTKGEEAVEEKEGEKEVTENKKDEEETHENSATTTTETTTTAAAVSTTTDTGLMIPHMEDTHLLENVRFDEENENDLAQQQLTILDQAIVLAFCLIVKTNNPTHGQDDLTAEEMMAYLARVLIHHDDWMVYATALLERAWLEFDTTHSKERALLQLQALADQHTNRLTLTQSTMKSITEDSSPVQDRLRNVHSIVYPPQWSMKHDLAVRYAGLGIVTSAAELFTEVEDWDHAVDCYTRAGKQHLAESMVRERLAIRETPRMWTALGDLTNDPNQYQRAIDLSKGRFSQAYVSLGKYHFDKGDLLAAFTNYKQALSLRPLIPFLWFRVGTISMQLGRWDDALQAFSEVVQQEPTEAEAWANIAAVHMRNHNSAAAYPALGEALKQNRNNWRAWVSKLFVTLDLEKYDEAVQACNTLLDFQTTQSTSGIPPLEEKCVRAIVGGTLKRYQEARQPSKQHQPSDDGDNGLYTKNVENTAAAALDSARRSLTRVHDLLERLTATIKDPWIFETMAYFHANLGKDDEQVKENLMKEYRSLQSIRGWEKDDTQVSKICDVVSEIVRLSLEALSPLSQPLARTQDDGKDNGDGSTEDEKRKKAKEQLAKSKFLMSGVIQRVRKSRRDMTDIPDALTRLDTLLQEVNQKLDIL